MKDRKPHTVSRGQFVSLGAIVLSLLIIIGVGVAYVGISGQEERDNSITPTQDVEQSSLSIARSTSDVFATTNQDPEISDYDTRKNEVNDSIRQHINSFGENYSSVYDIVDYKIRKTYSGHMVSITDPSANLTDKSGANEWSAFSNADDARQAVMILNLSTMPDYSNSTQPGVEINNKEMHVKYLKTGPAVELIVDGGDSCSVAISDTDRVRVDFLRGEINNRACGEIRIDSAVNDLTVYSGNNTNQTVRGTFSTIYFDPDETSPDVEHSSNLPRYGETETPKHTKVVYAVVMDLRIVELGSSITKPVIISPGKHQRPLE